MSHWSETYKPAAAAHVHLFAACLMWTVVGSFLAFFGASWLWRAPANAAPWMTAAAAAVGILKSRTILDRAARNMTHRILARGDGHCIGGFLSVRSWALVLSMVVVGRLARGTVGRDVVGSLYIAVGTSLIVSSRLLWRAWHRHRAAHSSHEM